MCLRDWGLCVSVGHTGHLAERPISDSESDESNRVRRVLFGFRWESEPKAKGKILENKGTTKQIYLGLNTHFRKALQSRSAVSSGRTDVHPRLQPGRQFTLALRHLAPSPSNSGGCAREDRLHMSSALHENDILIYVIMRR